MINFSVANEGFERSVGDILTISKRFYNVAKCRLFVTLISAMCGMATRQLTNVPFQNLKYFKEKQIMTKTTFKKSGFTLIELLVVIGLLAALAAILLPTLMGTREDALAGIDKYNSAGTLRTLRQYEVMTGELPNGMHTGLKSATGTELMDVPKVFSDNAARSGSITTLDQIEIDALEEIGITKLAYDANSPVTYENITETTNVIVATPDWVGEDGNILTFNGKTIAELQNEGYSKIINLFVTPTAIWDAAGKGWVKGFGVKMDIPGTCPIPDEEFSYYTAFIGIMAEGAKCEISGTDAASAPKPTSLTAGSIADLKDAIETAVDADSDWTLGSWDDSVDGVSTVTVTDTGSATATYTITELSAKETKAVLIGTSCPEHGVTNP
jgi:prepilin-type N-terminal cleavage/methylation domain-containing protein